MRRTGRIALIVVAVLGLALSIGVIAVLALPAFRSVGETGIADGSRAFGIADDDGRVFAEAVPEAGWSVQPDPQGGGLLLRSPDRLLEVRLGPAGPESVAEPPEAPGHGEMLREILEGGVELRHRTVGSELRGVLEASTPVLVRATALRGAELDRYRPALAELLVSVAAEHAAEDAAPEER
ncbi:hypothetical protein J4H92_04520 [Leucobacter weissii]|uniref:Uncharacterized protein n=1 Tax=Leucobacter weissii TaxID=1983706 RepID=A0A939S7P6_9MICO|nr:hypothetical protein [Leucobacter weissii]MBO1901211.1 hypothetical protein [Leucobacter weissii]